MKKKEEKAPKEEAKKEEGKEREGGETVGREAELITQLQRLQAEFENYKKRTESAQALYREQAQGRVLADLLPIIDNLELALLNATAAEKDGFYKGVEMIYAQLTAYLETHGVTEIVAEGRFDPNRHEALMTEAAEGKAPGSIIEVLQKGYEQKGRVIRTTKVKVAK